jgi:FdhE protein
MFDELLKHIDRLIRQRPHAKEALEAYKDLLACLEDAEPSLDNIKVEESLVTVKREEGFPLLSREELPVDHELSRHLLHRLLDHLKDRDRQDSEGLERAGKKMSNHPAWADRLFEAVLHKSDKTLSALAEDSGLDPNTLSYLARLALRPSLLKLRNILSQRIEKEKWDFGYCPLCGSQPNMAFMDKTGKRHLHCELCGEEWSFRRVTCPFCQNEDQKQLGYFQSDQEEGFRVDFCRACKRYIKTVDQRVFEEATPMELEYIASLHLDILAGEQGFR